MPGFINRYVLGLLIAAWLSAAAIFGFLDARPLDGLHLFKRPATLETPRAYTDIVQGYQQEDASPIEIEVPQQNDASSIEIGATELEDVPTYVVSVTAEQPETPIPEPVFWVSGADHTIYLRTATGDVYEQGRWWQLDPAYFLVDEGSSIPDNVVTAMEEARGGPAGSWSPERLDAALLASPMVEPVESVPDLIAVTAFYEEATFSEGVVPSVNHLVGVNTPAAYYPFSATLRLEEPVYGYQLEMSIPHFDPGDVFGAAPAKDSSYLQISEDLPARVLELAEQFKGNESPYVRANQIHRYLRERLAFLTSEPGGESIERPTGHDPVDWFLFERRAGDGGNFSSAFVILARAAGIPARVVSGWAIKRDAGHQVVNADQAHQWAEIALDGVGWITFDPVRQDAFPLRGEEQSLLSLIEELTNSGDQGIREDAAYTLGDLGEPDALPALLGAALNDESVAVRLGARTAILRIGIEYLIRILLNYEDPLVRENAAEILGVYGSSKVLGADGSSKAVDALLQALSSDVDARVRTASIGALEKIGGEAAEIGVLQAAVADEEVSVREVAVRALGKMKARWTAEEIVALLREDANAVIREAAAWTLGELKEAVALQPLIDARHDPVEAVREAVAEALRKWLIPDLTIILQEADDPVQRAAAAKLLGEIGGIAAVPALNWALNDPVITVRNAALNALNSMGEITILENGCGILTAERGRAFISGTTTQARPQPPATPIFAVEGASHTGYLRTGVGDIYANGQWLAEKQTGFAYESFSDIVPDASIHPTLEAVETHREEITVLPSDSSRLIPAGIVPTSKRLERIEISGMFWQPSATFANHSFRNSYSWSSIVHEYSEAQLNAAGRVTGLVNSPYTSLPEWARRGRIRDLAIEITSGHSTPYAQAKAIERYLRTEYSYRPPETSRDWVLPAGQDLVDWFLFDKREGTSGNFSSAFVFLARAVGLPARVVSGWAIGITPSRQTISSDQAHQWAEVAFEGLGWIDFDPTPGGPRARAALETLAGGNPDAVADALEALEEAGEEVVRLENGGAILEKGGKQYFVPGTTTMQSPGLLETPLFQITGAANTSRLRTSVGDLYQGGGWRQLDPVSIDARPNTSISGATWAQLGRPTSEFGELPLSRRNDASLFGFRQNEYTVQIDDIQMKPVEPAGNLPIGRVPTSLDLRSVGMQGVYYPFSSTFRLLEQASIHTWTSRIVSFQAQYLEQADAAGDQTYLQLLPDMPPRIQELAQQITSGYTSPYAKAKALEAYLKTEYSYKLADSPYDLPQPGRDPVDWFLFDHREGTCGVFSSAFVVMARSVGIPARVVSGWAISQTADTQIVRANQAHQWAEVALEGIGWVTFEPTAGGGAPSRAGEGTGGDGDGDGGAGTGMGEATGTGPGGGGSGGFGFGAGEPEELPQDTVSGRPVSDMEVEVYVNETKEHGGTLIGTVVTHSGRWSAVVRIPRDMELGAYQLLARAVENDDFNESWSDPDITVYSGSGIELTGPTQVPVDDEAIFVGRLSDDTGQGLEDREMIIAVNGTVTDSIITSPRGTYSFTLTFSEPGHHWVNVEVAEMDFILGNSARIGVEATLPTKINLEAPVSVETGEEFRVTGTLLGVRGEPLADRLVVISIGESLKRYSFTDDDGAFEGQSSLGIPGVYIVRAEFERDGWVLASTATAGLVVRERALLTLDGPSTIELGSGGMFTGLLTTAAGVSIPQSALSIVDASGADLATVTTDDDGGFEYQHSSFLQTGPQSLTAQYPGADLVLPSSARIAFSVLAQTSMSLELPAIVRDGDSFMLLGRLRDVNGDPVPDVEVEVTGGGCTDAPDRCGRQF